MAEDDIKKIATGLVSGALTGGVEREEAASVGMPDEIAMLGQVHYLLKDEDVAKLLTERKEYRVLIPALSHLNRTSSLSAFEANIIKRRIKLAADIVLFTKKHKNINLEEVAFLQSLLVYASASANDAINGWRGRLITERTRTYRVETPTQEKKGFWTKLFGR